MLALTMSISVALAQPLAAATPAEHVAALYDEVCLRAFPDDAAVDRLLAAKGGMPLTAEQTKVTLNDDPGRGWQIKQDGRHVLVFLELPPFHGCSVRFPLGGQQLDLTAYRAVATPFMAARPTFAPTPPYDADRDGIHIHAIGEARPAANGGQESLFVIDQHITDPVRRQKGETGVMLRFVHQFRLPQ